MKKRTVIKRVSVVFLAILLSLTMLGAGAFAQEMNGSNEPADDLQQTALWAETIDEMLDGRQYVEGEVIAVYDNSLLPVIDLPGEDLGDVSGEAAEETFDDVNVNDAADAVSIKVITSEDKTTRQLLEELAADPAVISAEPNYIFEAPEIPADGTEEIEGDFLPAEEEDADTVLFEEEPGDTLIIEEDDTLLPAEDEPAEEETLEPGAEEILPDEEAILPEEDADEEDAVLLNEDENEGMDEIYLLGEEKDFIENQGYDLVGDLSYLQWCYGETDAAGHYSLHSPNWNQTGGTNVDPEKEMVVAVMDSGIDYTHPDLAPVMADMTEYNMDVGGKYGYNCSGEDAEDDPMDHNGHGTHCAGIIAASWDGTGTSGVASGVKLCAVRTSVNGGFSNVAVTKGFLYLAKACDNGMNLKSINCSFGGENCTNVYRLMMNELGKRGVVTCFASGNSSLDNDKVPVTSSVACNSPYGLVVNSANPNYMAADYTDFGQTTTTFFSPGDAILATVSKADSRYLPCIDPNRKAYETFAADDDSGVKVMYLDTYNADKTSTLHYSSEEFLNLVENWKEAGKRVSGSESFDKDSCSYEIDAPKLKSKSDRAVYLVSVPVNKEDASAIKYFGFSVKSTLGKSVAWVRAVNNFFEEYHIAVGGTDGWLRPSDVWCSYNITMDTDGENAYPYYNGRMYFFVMLSDFAATSQKSKLYLDCIGAGTDTLRYVFYQGTSMATPAICGSVPVMFEKLEQEGRLDGLTPGEQAAAVVETMKASTLYSAGFDSLCSSNGAFDFAIPEENYAPVINSVTFGADGTMKITGKYFGQNIGTLKWDDYEMDPEPPYGDAPARRDFIKSWSDTEITAQLVELKINGLQNISIETKNGRKTSCSVILNGNSGNPVYEGKITMPEEIADCCIDSMTGLGGKAYLVPETVNTSYMVPKVDEQLWSFDPATDSWTRCKNIPWPEELKSNSKSPVVEINPFGKYLLAHITYNKYSQGESGPSGIPEYIEKVYFYNPEKDTWTEADFGDLELPNFIKVFGTDNGVFFIGGNYIRTVHEDDGTEYYDMEHNNTIYAFQFDTDAVESGKASVAVTALKDAGFCDNDPNSYVSGHTVGNSTVFPAIDNIWLKWSDTDQKFTYEGEHNLGGAFSSIGKLNSSVRYVSTVVCGTNTPFGAAYAGIPGNSATGRGFDTMIFNQDGTVTSIDKYASFADVYNTRACYSDGYLFVWGDSYYNESQTLGYMAYMKLVKQATPLVTLSKTAYTYDGKAKTPSVTVEVDGQTLKKDRDYTVSYASGRINAGTYKVSVKLKGSYDGSASAAFTINPKEVTPSVTLNKTAVTYNGKVRTPSVTVKVSGKTLKKNTDYTVSYASGRKNAGKYKVTVKLKGNYKGSATKTFTIKKAANTLKVKGKTASVAYSKLKKKSQTLAVSKTIKFTKKGKGKMSYKLSSAKKSGKSFKKYFSINAKTGKITVKKGLKKGTYKLKVKAVAKGGTNYKKGTQTVTITIKVK